MPNNPRLPSKFVDLNIFFGQSKNTKMIFTKVLFMRAKRGIKKLRTLSHVHFILKRHYVETTWKRSSPGGFNVECAWCVCREVTKLLPKADQDTNFSFAIYFYIRERYRMIPVIFFEYSL